MLKGKTIVIGVCGGIAAYKACDVVSKLKKVDADVHVVMTKSAQEFVNPLTFQALSNNYVVKNMFDEPRTFDIEHISLAKKADAFVIIPATANIIGKLASGIADDMLTTTVMATKAPVIIAPAMNTNMYNNNIVQENIDKLITNGYKFISPCEGRLACGDTGVGKLADTDDIVEYIIQTTESKRDLSGLKILITAGPTRENIDPVRFITNHSSGKMGYETAKVAKMRGANVTVITGPVNIPKTNGIEYIDINTSQEMFEAIKDIFINYDIIIKAAAVSDYRPYKTSESKIKKKDNISLELVRNPDILSWLGNNKTRQVIVGFSMETENLTENSTKKLKEKNIDFIVANDLTVEGAGFGSDTNVVRIIDKNGNIEDLPKMSKFEIAGRILDKALTYKKSLIK